MTSRRRETYTSQVASSDAVANIVDRHCAANFFDHADAFVAQCAAGVGEEQICPAQATVRYLDQDFVGLELRDFSWCLLHLALASSHDECFCHLDL
jgi:hypothetical protein